MTQCSPSNSEALTPSASSSALGKRRTTSDDSPPSPRQLSGLDAVEAQDPSYEEDPDDQPPKKKVKRLLTKKVAVWKDIKEWKEGEEGIGRFPVEILDRIISADSDLDLRDHLALAAVCRYFRTCYRDVVFQVLFQVHYPHLQSHSRRLQFDLSDGNPTRTSGTWSPRQRGPLTHSLADGRRIFSSGRSLVGAGGWFGWGVSRDDIKANKRLYLRSTEDISAICQSEWELLSGMEPRDKVDRLVAVLERTRLLDNDITRISEKERGKAVRLLEKLEVSYLDYRRQIVQREVLISLGLRPTPDPLDDRTIERTPLTVGDSDSSGYKPSSTYFFDPWPSEWREVVRRVVGEGMINRADAISEYKVSQRELLTLKQRAGPNYGRPCFSRSGVEALAWRSHGGKEGHAAHLFKLASRKSKKEATEAKNGTTRSKASTTSSLIGPLSRSETTLAQTRLLETTRVEALRLEEVRRSRFEEIDKLPEGSGGHYDVARGMVDGFRDWLSDGRRTVEWRERWLSDDEDESSDDFDEWCEELLTRKARGG